LEVIEHVENVPMFIDSLSRMLKPGGSIFISTINKTYISFLLTIVVAEYLLRWLPTGVTLIEVLRENKEVFVINIASSHQIFQKI
jgi:2-polyprenyl-3-methyl-5-hydroxy-6-metoxy-1,4-benzoquinol methylase